MKPACHRIASTDQHATNIWAQGGKHVAQGGKHVAQGGKHVASRHATCGQEMRRKSSKIKPEPRIPRHTSWRCPSPLTTHHHPPLPPPRANTTTTRHQRSKSSPSQEYLGPGWPRVDGHRLEHLGRTNHRLTREVALADHHLLGQKDLETMSQCGSNGDASKNPGTQLEPPSQIPPPKIAYSGCRGAVPEPPGETEGQRPGTPSAASLELRPHIKARSILRVYLSYSFK